MERKPSLLFLFGHPDDESFTYFPSPQRADMPKIRLTREGGIWYSPRSSQKYPGFGVLYPDITKITTLAAYAHR